MVKNYRDLTVWQKAMKLTVAIYEETKKLPKTETYGLIDQLRRASVSVASNIAEGSGRTTTYEYIQFLGYAKGSLHEVETQIELCIRVGYFQEPEIKYIVDMTEEIDKMLGSLIEKLKIKRYEKKMEKC